MIRAYLKESIHWLQLINVKTLELSYLEPDEARELMERPVPDFNMRYEAGVVDTILELTHCQPYLLQAIGSELVNYLNARNRMTATVDDLNVAVEKALISAQAYFHYVWAEECSDEERNALLALAADDSWHFYPGGDKVVWHGLLHKQIVEKAEGGYRFSIKLFHHWILQTRHISAPPIRVPIDRAQGVLISARN